MPVDSQVAHSRLRAVTEDAPVTLSHVTDTALIDAAPRRRRAVRRKAVANLVLDLALVVAFLVDMNLRFTGLAIHEWLGLGIGAALVLHLLLHWEWTVGTTRHLLGRVRGRARLSWVLALLLFIDMTLLVVTGILISRSAVPALLGTGRAGEGDRFFRWLHVESSHWALYLVAAHTALGVRWLVTTTRTYVLRRRARPAAAAEPAQ